MAQSPALIEATTRHSVFLERLKTGEARKFEPFLREMDRMLRERLSRVELTELSRQRLERLLGDVDGRLLAIFAKYREQLAADLIDIAQYEASFEARALDRVLEHFESTLPSERQVRAAVLSAPLGVRGTSGGKLLTPFIRDWSRNEREMLTGIIRRGYYEGATTQQIIRELRGTAGRRFSDGALATVNRHAGSLVRTAVQHVASVARMEAWAANDDVVVGYHFIATLDSKTSVQCRALDQQVFKRGKGPVPPLHPNCRSTTVAELDGRFSQLAEGRTRASEDGPVSGSESYYSWLKKQPAEFQDEVIGPTRGKLLREGGISVERFRELQLHKNFTPMTLEDMRRLEPLAFERAGI